MKIEFNDLYFCKTNKLDVVSFFVNNVAYYYFIDLTDEVDLVYVCDTCKYQGEVNSGYQEEHNYKLSLTKLDFYDVFDNGQVMFFDFIDKQKIEAYLSAYLNEHPEIVN